MPGLLLLRGLARAPRRIPPRALRAAPSSGRERRPCRRPAAASCAPAPPGPRARHRCRGACRRASAGRPPNSRARWRSRSPAPARQPGGRARPPSPPRRRRWRGSRSGVGQRDGPRRGPASVARASASAARGAACASRVKARAVFPWRKGIQRAWNAARSRAMLGTKWPEATSEAAKRRTAQKKRRSSPPATPGAIRGFAAAARRRAIAWPGGSGMAVTVQGLAGARVSGSASSETSTLEGSAAPPFVGSQAMNGRASPVRVTTLAAASAWRSRSSPASSGRTAGPDGRRVGSGPRTFRRCLGGSDVSPQTSSRPFGGRAVQDDQATIIAGACSLFARVARISGAGHDPAPEEPLSMSS